jgi:hypothetical protein
MRRRTSLELLSYTRVTLRLIERYSDHAKDPHIVELKLALQRCITEFESETGARVNEGAFIPRDQAAAHLLSSNYQ